MPPALTLFSLNRRYAERTWLLQGLGVAEPRTISEDTMRMPTRTAGCRRTPAHAKSVLNDSSLVALILLRRRARL